MGAPTGSTEVVMFTLPAETGCCGLSAVNPVMVIVAGDFTDCCLIFAQVSASGTQVWVTACCGVSLVRSLGGPAWGSSSPGCISWPETSRRISLAWPANETSTTQRFAESAASRHRNVGGVISGGNTEPSRG